MNKLFIWAPIYLKVCFGQEIFFCHNICIDGLIFPHFATQAPLISRWRVLPASADDLCPTGGPDQGAHKASCHQRVSPVTQRGTCAPFPATGDPGHMGPSACGPGQLYCCCNPQQVSGINLAKGLGMAGISLVGWALSSFWTRVKTMAYLYKE